MKIGNILIGVVSLIILTLIQDRICSKKEDRAKLFLLIPVAAIYSGIAIFAFTKLYNHIESFLLKHGLGTYSVVVINLLIIAGYLVVKIIVGKLLIKKLNGYEFVNITSSSVYRYVEEYNNWFLRYKWINYRAFLNAIRWSSLIIAGVVMGIMKVQAGESYVIYAFPCIIPLVLSETYHFFNGQTKGEFEHDILGSDSMSRRAGNYYKLREIFEKLLPSPLLSSQTGFSLAGKRPPADYIEKLDKSQDKLDKITASYFKTNDRYMKAELDGVKTTIDLLHRKNVVFFNPFYRDLDMYLTLPLFSSLASGKKCMIITGRMSARDDVKKWIENLISEYTHMPSLWKAGNLSTEKSDYDIGILGFPELYDDDVIVENREFFKNTDFVLLIEPSLILSTGQTALSIVSQEMGDANNKPVFFVCDRMVDGLVDTISHIIRAEFIEVSAPPVPRCIYTGMSWDANGDFERQRFFERQTKYLGNGIELAAIAIKNQIPHVSWYGETKVPMKDIKWIAGQYYPVICEYMNQPVQQSTLYEKISFISNLWNGAKNSEEFVVVEDEFNNMFSIMRLFISRGMEQSFVNVLSENYLLRDYMRCNQQMFLSNPNAVPSLIADYAKTERNTLIKLLLIMSCREVSDKEIVDEFKLVGCKSDNAYDLLGEMLEKYTNADRGVLDIRVANEDNNETSEKQIGMYSISTDSFRTYFEKSLAKAYYILEEEIGRNRFVDAKFFNHVTQSVMQGQFVTYEGKYYQVKQVSPQSGVVLRRASDLFEAREYYRQIREYELPECCETVLSKKALMDLEISFVQRNVKVRTTGYLIMKDLCNLRTARKVDISDDPHIYDYKREYRNKTILKIKLPEAGEDVRFTFCLILSEIMRSLFPNGHPYIAVTTKVSEDISGMLSYIVYPISGEIDDDYIYIIEDSEIDLGLIEAIERNLMRIMEIIGDYLKWHFEKMREPEIKDPVPPSYNYDKEKLKSEKQSMFARMADRIRKLMGAKNEEPVSLDFIGENFTSPVKNDDKEQTFKDEEQAHIADDSNEKGDKKKEEDIQVTVDDENTILADDREKAETTSDAAAINVSEEIPSEVKNPVAELSDVDGTDIFDESGEAEDNTLFEVEFKAQGLIPLDRTRYQKECFLKFGYEEIDSRLNIEELMKYLRVRGWTESALTQARTKDVFDKKELDVEAENHCDFCGRPISGASYDLLNDGRVRCNDCSASAISSTEELKALLYQILELMEAFYGISYKVPISVTATDARTVAKGVGQVFKPSTELASRVLGYAQKKNGKYSLVIENGSPRLAAVDTIVHEMTHIWQYMKWDDEAVKKIFDIGNEKLAKIAVDIVYEGMAVWAAVQYLYQIGETYYASQLENMTERRQDVYGWGFTLYRDQYPLVKDSRLLKVTPFSVFPTLEPSRVTEFITSLLNNNENE